eukprot:CAMPEP_0194136106 /NCGR_PEP_ID=MMETSP0152-20130528/6137_1 /TAXON_ID=1049557 /ORGANISM="Thalassiothrix antarctica, Strain L6-D1" /LENGTH=263 /DNA_ID=CAMNT_0038832619 /DNA_START=190 /DNA_END=977 /DNA_ORIENTATION=+
MLKMMSSLSLLSRQKLIINNNISKLFSTNHAFDLYNKSREGGEVVSVLKLNELRDNPGAIKKKRRIGRGIGCSKGKTCGRGHKGQKARGKVHPWFEGGQTNFIKRIPKRGMKNRNATPMLGINLGKIQDYIDMGRLDPTYYSEVRPLNMKDMVDVGIVGKANSIQHGVKILADGANRLRTPIRIEASRASESAIHAMESIGGEITTVHYNRLALRALLKPHKFSILPKRAKPPPRLLPYYQSYKNRGYLSPQVQMKQLLRNKP